MNSHHGTRHFLGQQLGSLELNGTRLHYVKDGSGWRYETILDKEPETIDWINRFEPSETMWDIGANVGIYSLYAAMRGVKVIAFEPHFANYFQLCSNICINQLDELVVPLGICLGDRPGVGTFNMQSIGFGASMSSYGNSLDFRGREFKPEAALKNLSLSIDDLISCFGLEIPDHIKLDVDGIELDILYGARETIRNAHLKSVSVELIETDLKQVATVSRMLEDCNFSLAYKTNNPEFATPDTKDVKNYLFVRGVDWQFQNGV